MDEAALKNSIETEVDMGLIYTSISNLNKAKTQPHLIQTLRTGYGLSTVDAIRVLSDRIEHFKKLIFEQFEMTEEYYNEVIAANMS